LAWYTCVYIDLRQSSFHPISKIIIGSPREQRLFTTPAYFTL
jgi:hypothetical protein